MLTFIQSIILGIIQGITEWLPVSSSGHLVIVQQLFGIEAPLFYDILLHIGTLIVIFLVFWKDIFLILKSVFSFNFKSEHGRLALFIIAGSIPTAAIGFIFHDTFASFFTNIRAVAMALIVTGFLLYFSEKKEKNKKLTYFDSILIGIVQGIAIIPGISRSGSTISVGLLRGIKKEIAAKFSFLLSIPAIIGAAIFEGANVDFTGVNIAVYLVGILVSIIIGYLSIELLLKLISRKKFHYFAYYCWVAGLVLFLI